jgi:beta-lactamase regulating signal transducer with metallopeptidase domain
MNQLAPALFGKILEATLSASILAAIVFLLQVALRKRLSAAWRFALWIPVLIRLLIPVLPETPFSIFNAPRWLRSVMPGTPQVTVEIKDRAAIPTILPLANPSDLAAAETSFAVAPLQKPVLTTFQKVTLLWLTVSLALLLRLALGTLWLNLRLRKHRTLPSPFLLRVFLTACEETRTRWKPRLIQTTLIESPGLFGFICPKLLLPSAIDSQLTETELRHIFLHELAHLKRGDLLTNWFMSIAHAIHWFNPIVWFLLRRMRLERELACDALALESAGPEGSRAYGETILKLLDHVKRSMPLPAMVGILEEKQTAKSRLKQIAAFKNHSSLAKFGLPLLLATVFFGLSDAQSKPSTTLEKLKPDVADDSTYIVQDPSSPEAITVLEEEWAKQKKIVAEAQKNTDQLKGTLGISDPTADFGVLEQKDRDRAQAEAQYIHQNELLRQLKGKTRAELRKIIPTTYPNPKLDHLLQELHQAEQQLAAVLVAYTHNHPTDRRLEEIIKTIDKQIDEEIDGTLLGLETKVAQAKALSDKFKESVELARKENAEKLALYEPYFAARRNLKREQTVLDTIYQRIQAHRFTIKVVEDARILMEMGKLDDAENKLQETLTSAPAPLEATELLAAIRKKKDQQLINDAHLLMETGELDEAEVELKAALANNPDLRAAQYYLGLINQRRKSLIAQKNRVIPPTIKTDMLEAKLDSSELPDKPVPLYTRTFKLNPTVFLENMERLQGPKLATTADPTVGTNRIQTLVRNYFESKGVNFKANAIPLAEGQPVTAPQKAIFFNDRTGVLFVRATLADLDKVETSLHTLNTKSHEVEFYCRLISLPPEAGAEFIKQRFSQPTYSVNAVATVTSVMNDDQIKRTIEALKGGSNTVSLSNRTVTITGLMSDPQFSNVVATLGQTADANGKTPQRADASQVFNAEKTDLMQEAEAIKGSQVLGGVSLLAFTGQTAVIKVAAGPKMEITDSYDSEKQQHQLRADVGIPQSPNPIALTAYGSVHQGETYVFAKNAKLPQHKGVPILSDIPALGPLFENTPTEERTILFFIVPKAR